MVHYKIYNQKLIMFAHAMIVIFMCIAARLVFLQIIEHHRLKKISQQNFLRFKIVPTQRGHIVDCNKIPLATNIPTTSLFWQGTGNHHLADQQIECIEKLCTILSLDYQSLIKKFKKAEKYKLEILISEYITNDQLYLIAEQCSESGNLVFKTNFKRFYPFGHVACHLLGYLGDLQVQAEGKMGLEKLFENTLKGNPAIFLQSTNSFGTLLNSKQIETGSNGQEVETTLDLQLQNMVEAAMSNEIAGSCIILDPLTGGIKALVSKPNFDPNIFHNPINQQTWKQLQHEQAFLNRALNANYPPASIFKLVTIAAALEKKITTTHSSWICCGYTTFKDRRYYCSRKEGHGYVDTADALALSCNIPFFEIAKHVHIDTLAQYAYKFGLGSKTNVPFSEKIGLIPTNEWKLEQKGERWWTGETLSATIGQSYLLVTPIQIACMIGSIFHGYLVKPQILISEPIEKKNIDIQPETRLFLQECMMSATQHGTAQRIKKMGNLTIFAKTGTAQTRTRAKNQDPEAAKKDRSEYEHAWFVGYFYIQPDQPLVIVMLLEHVGKSTYATNVARTFFMQFIKQNKKKIIAAKKEAHTEEKTKAEA